MAMKDLQWGGKTAGWQLSASLDQEELPVGTPVLVTLVARNASNQELRLPLRSRWTTYHFRVTRGGAEVPLSLFGKRMQNIEGETEHGLADCAAGAESVLEIEV